MRHILLVSVAAAALAGSVASAQVRTSPEPQYRGGIGSPTSDAASNTSSSNARTEIAPRLPDPNASDNSPGAFLAAAQRALNQGRTGAAQEALERAETRILSRTTEPSLAAQPSRSAMAMHIAEARRALGNRDIRGAKAAVALALTSPVPPPGPAVTTTYPAAPGSQPMPPAAGYPAAPPMAPMGRGY